MADSVSLGDALALNNTAKVERGHPITDAVKYQQRLNLGREAAKAKAESEKKKLQQAIYDKINIPYGKYLPQYDEQARKIHSEGLAEAYTAAQNGDVVGARTAQDKTIQAQDALQAENDRAVKTLSNDKLLVPQEFKDFLNDRSPDARAKLDKKMQENPVLNGFGGFSPTNGFTMNDIPNLPLENDGNVHQKTMQGQENNMMLDKSIAPVQASNSQLQYTKNLPKDQVSNIAKGFASDPYYALNTAYKKPAAYIEGQKAAENQAMGTFTPEQKTQYALQYAAEQNLNKYNRAPHFAPIEHPAQPREEKKNQPDISSYYDNEQSPDVKNEAYQKLTNTFGSPKIIVRDKNGGAILKQVDWQYLHEHPEAEVPTDKSQINENGGFNVANIKDLKTSKAGVVYGTAIDNVVRQTANNGVKSTAIQTGQTGTVTMPDNRIIDKSNLRFKTIGGRVYLVSGANAETLTNDTKEIIAAKTEDERIAKEKAAGIYDVSNGDVASILNTVVPKKLRNNQDILTYVKTHEPENSKQNKGKISSPVIGGGKVASTGGANESWAEKQKRKSLTSQK